MTERSPSLVTVKRVRRRLEYWRRTRPYGRAPIPESIWRDAVALARQCGVYEIARALPIHYGALKQHLEAAEQTAGSAARSRFVELTPMRSTACNDSVIEVDGPRARVRIRVHGIDLPDLARLSRVIAGVDA